MRRIALTGAFLAIDPRAFGMFFDCAPPLATKNVEGVAIVSIRGPMSQHEPVGYYRMSGDSYEEIARRVGEALAVKPKALVLALDTPGGDAAGVFELSETLRAMCDDAKVPLAAYIDGKATSAGYAIACAASRIVAPPSAFVGSIGTVCELHDITRMLEAAGVRVEVVASGERKPDGNPHQPITDAARASAKAHIDALAEQFFALVASRRPVAAEKLRELAGGLVLGADAKAIGLVDELGSLRSLVAQLASPTKVSAGKSGENAGSPGANTQEVPVDEDEKEARAALQAIADDEKKDEKARARARAALAAMAEDDEADPAEDEEDADAQAGGTSAKALATTALSMIKADRRAKAVSDLLATRPDLTPEQRAFAGTLEPKACEGYLATIPSAVDQRTKAVSDLLATRPDLTPEQRAFAGTLEPKAAAGFLATVPRQRRNPALTAAPGTLPTDTRPEASGTVRGSLKNPVFQQQPAAVEQMRVAMGISSPRRGVRVDANSVTVGGTVDEPDA